jgi:exodeoxyribonuclease-5
MDRDQADLAFAEIVEIWLREELADDAGGLAEMVLQDPGEILGLIHKILTHLRSRRTLTVEAPEALEPLIGDVR